MKAPFKPLLCVLAGLAFAATAPSARADAVKQKLYRLGADLWLMENLAVQVSRKAGGPTPVERQALPVILEVCLQDCQSLDFPCKGLLDLHRRRDKLSFAECARQMPTIKADILKHLEKTFGPQPRRSLSAQSYFLLGRYVAAAEFTSLHLKLSGQKENAAGRKFIYGMCLSSFCVVQNAQLEVSLARLKAVIIKVDQGASFAEQYDSLRVLKNGTWYEELGMAPPFAVGVQPAAGRPEPAARARSVSKTPELRPY